MTSDRETIVYLIRRPGEQDQPTMKPIVLDYKKRQKKAQTKAKTGKPRYTPGLADAQRLEGDAVHIAQSAARALSRSLDVYEEERRKSASKKKDGAIEDFIHNSARANSAFMKETSDIPIDLADAVSRLSFRKALRKNIRRAAKRKLLWPL